MPYSLDEGRHVLKRWLTDNRQSVSHILDVGPGAGTYADFIRPILPSPYLQIHAVEIHEPYVEQFSLDLKYDEIFISDFIEFANGTDAQYDLVILGDVIEHFPEEKVDDVWTAALYLAGDTGVVFVSTPIVEYPQGASHGNEHEAHLSQFSLERLESLPGVFSAWGGDVIGAALASNR